MLFSNSPVKKVAEKLNPYSQKNKVSRLKFERKSDYRTFLKFIKDNTKEIEDIKIPDPEDKKRKGLMIGGGLLGLALLASFGRGKGDSDDDNTGKLKSISGVIEKAKADSRKAASGGKDRRKFDQADDALDKARFEKSKRLNRIRKKFQKKGSIEQRKINLEEYLKKREKRKTRRVRKKYVKQPGFSVNPTKKSDKKVAVSVGGDTFKEQGLPKKGKKITISGGFNIDPDAKIGFPSEKDIKGEQKLTKKIFKSDVKKITSPKPGEKESAQDLINRLNRATKEADNIAERAKKIDTENTNKLRDSFKKSLNQPDASRVNPYNRFDPTAGFMDDDLGQRTGKTGDRVENIGRRKTVDRSKFFKAPEVPKKITPKQLNNFDKFNRFSNRILNSPAAKFATFMGGLFSSPKLQIIKTLMEPTPLADGTLEGKPVNIFLNNNQSMIPFNPDLKFNNDVIPPTDFPTPSSNIFIDPKQQLNIDDIFFLRSFSGG